MKKRAVLLGGILAVVLGGCGKDSAVQIVTPREKEQVGVITAENDSQTPLREQIDAPERIASEPGQEYSIVVDAKVEVPDVTGIQVKKVEQDEIDQEDLKKYQEVLFPGKELYRYLDDSLAGVWTKQEIRDQIEILKDKYDTWENPGEESEISMEIQRLDSLYQYAPETVETQPVELEIGPWKEEYEGEEEWLKTYGEENMEPDPYNAEEIMTEPANEFPILITENYQENEQVENWGVQSSGEEWAGLQIENESPEMDAGEEGIAEGEVSGEGEQIGEKADSGQGEDSYYLGGYVKTENRTYSFSASNGPEFSNVSLTDLSTVCHEQHLYLEADGEVEIQEDYSKKEAREQAELLLKQLQMEDFQSFCEMDDLVSNAGEMEFLDCWSRSYGFIFTRCVDQIPVTYPGPNVMELVEGCQQSEYAEVIFDRWGLKKFELTAPCRISDYSSDSVFLLPFSEIMNIFEGTIGSQFAELLGGRQDLSLTIDRVVLGYARIRNSEEENSGLLIPVWDFFGKLEAVDGEMPEEDWYILNLQEHSWLTINAMDGTIVDRMYL